MNDDRDRPWQDTSLPAHERVDAVISRMTAQEKVAQLVGIWVGVSTEGATVAPHQNDMGEPVGLDELLPDGVGQLTRPFGTAPLEPAVGAARLAELQRRIVAANRFGIPAVAHEECLAGFTTWKATLYPVPLAWGATFDPAVVGEMAQRIGTSMRRVGVHQGLAPVLDVTRDPRWGRTEETIGEDPYLVATLGTAYVAGLERSGIVATAKHFVGYSASRAGRNLAPVSIGPRELADVLLPPFEMAIAEGGLRSVMHSYSDIDGIPVAADRGLLTGQLRELWGFEGTVVSDYFGIGFLKLLHGVAADWQDAAVLALQAGIDVELPDPSSYRRPLLDAIAEGRIAPQLVDRALRRVLHQKLQLGLLDADWSPVPAALHDAPGEPLDLDIAQDRAHARRLAERSVVLLSNDGTLPLSSEAMRIAVIGPCADDPMTMLGCYSFPNHVGQHHPQLGLGVDIPTVRAAIEREFPAAAIEFSVGCAVDGDDRRALPEAVAVATGCDLVVAVVGDRAGLFGNGTSGEGCDAETLDLPGVQQELLDALAATGTPLIVVVVSGRPYALGEAAQRAVALVQAFFPGEEGGAAIAGVLSGRVNPSGRLPVSVPRSGGGQPTTYLAAPLARRSEVSSIDPTPLFGFGHGIGYSRFEWSQVSLDTLADGPISADGEAGVSVLIANVGDRHGAEVVQLYLHDPVASVVRPVRRLIGFARLELAPGERSRVHFAVPMDVTSFIGPDGDRIVEPGRLVFEVARSSSDVVDSVQIDVAGPMRTLDHDRARHCRVTIAPARRPSGPGDHDRCDQSTEEHPR